MSPPRERKSCGIDSGILFDRDSHVSSAFIHKGFTHQRFQFGPYIFSNSICEGFQFRVGGLNHFQSEISHLFGELIGLFEKEIPAALALSLCGIDQDLLVLLGQFVPQIQVDEEPPGLQVVIVLEPNFLDFPELIPLIRRSTALSIRNASGNSTERIIVRDRDRDESQPLPTGDPADVPKS